MAIAPIDYSLNVQAPIEQAVRGLQLGAGLADVRAKREAETVAIAETQRLAEERARQSAVLTSFMQKKNKTFDDYEQVMLAIPGQAESLRKSWEARSEVDQSNSLNELTQVYAALDSGRPEVAADLLNEKADALANSGAPEQQVKVLRDMARTAEISPETLQTTVGLNLAAIPGGDVVLGEAGRVSEEERAAAGEGREVTAEARAAAAEGRKVEAEPFVGLEAGYENYLRANNITKPSPVSYRAWQKDVVTQLKAGAAVTNINLGKLSKGQEKIDENFAAEYVAWGPGGGSADAVKQIDQLQAVSDELGAVVAGESDKNLSGAVVGSTPDFLMKFSNPDALATKDQVEEVVQRNLRLILGAQFTAEEGKRLIARAYNINLGEAENKKRVDALIGQMQAAKVAKDSASAYIEANGTLKGWTGKTPKMADFNKAISGKTTDYGVEAPAAEAVQNGAGQPGITGQGGIPDLAHPQRNITVDY